MGIILFICKRICRSYGIFIIKKILNTQKRINEDRRAKKNFKQLKDSVITLSSFFI